MSASAKITFDWADGTYTFRLPIEQLLELQALCDLGPKEIYDRLQSGTWRVADMRETLRLGLIGGGLKPVPALQLVRNYVDQRPLLENVKPAISVLMAALVGVPDDVPKVRAKGERGKAKRGGTTKPDASSQVSSMAPAP